MGCFFSKKEDHTSNAEIITPNAEIITSDVSESEYGYKISNQNQNFPSAGSITYLEYRNNNII
jgi:hypothetical protein